MRRSISSGCFVFFLTLLINSAPLLADISVDTSQYHPGNGSVKAEHRDRNLIASWPIDETTNGQVVFNLDSDQPLIKSFNIVRGETNIAVIKNVDPVYYLTVGTRDLSQPSGWVAFFDDPPKRPHQTYLAKRISKTVQVISDSLRCTFIFDGVTAGNFHGDLRFTFYPGTRLVHVEAAVKTEEDSRAILYDTGLVTNSPGWKTISFFDSHDQWQSIDPKTDDQYKAEPVRFRTLIAENNTASLAVFPPPHQYFYPLDNVDNYGFVWHGKNFHNLTADFGFGIRQQPEGDKRHVPWINAPPGTLQKLGVFYLLSDGDAKAALEQVKAYTRGDQFKPLAGYHTFTSHYHIEHTLDFVDRQKEQKTTGIPAGLEEPDFARRFKAMGVEMVHLAEFHIGWNKALTAKRLDLLKTMHDECERLSSDKFLLIPGEEPDVHLGGHWLSLFPKPVYWTLDRAKDQPFVEQTEKFGTVYHTGNSDDILKLMQAEHGLMWIAHARIKGSFGFPDVYKSKDFFTDDHFLGAAWKAMPSDNSLPRLGSRVLDLTDDMANWGLHKVTIGEVDAFKVHDQSELYGHININYVKLDHIPKFNDGWQPLLDSLRAGKLFVTTGEVLIPQYTIGGKTGGEILHLTPGENPKLEVNLEWTFPLAFAELVTGDGKNIFRQHIDLSHKSSFGEQTISIPAQNLTGKKWARFEVWDIAANGAFSEPVWIE